MELPHISAVGIYAAPSKTVSAPRRVVQFELELPMEEGGISYVDGQACKITPNTAVCSKPGQSRHTKFPYKCYFIHLLVPEGIICRILHRLPSFIPLSEPQQYWALFQKATNHYRSGQEEDWVVLHSTVLEIIYRLKQDAGLSVGGTQLQKPAPPAVKQAMYYIMENYSQPMTLETIAGAVHLSPVHFHNLFKTATGKTLREYVEDVRLQQATNLMLSTNLTLTEIALLCGFASQSYFSFVFKRKLHMTPRAYVQHLYSQYPPATKQTEG